MAPGVIKTNIKQQEEHTSTTPVLHNLHWLPVRQCINHSLDGSAAQCCTSVCMVWRRCTLQSTARRHAVLDISSSGQLIASTFRPMHQDKLRRLWSLEQWSCHIKPLSAQASVTFCLTLFLRKGCKNSSFLTVCWPTVHLRLDGFALYRLSLSIVHICKDLLHLVNCTKKDLSRTKSREWGPGLNPKGQEHWQWAWSRTSTQN